MELSILDTDVLSQLLKQRNSHVVARASQYLQEHQQFTFSALTHYEVVRGMKHRRAQAQLVRFTEFSERSRCQSPIRFSPGLPISGSWVDKAATLTVTQT